MLKVGFLTVACVIAFSANAQIVLENLYTDANQGFTMVPIDSGEYKYVNVDYFDDEITLYNLDHSVYSTIPFSLGSVRNYPICLLCNAPLVRLRQQPNRIPCSLSGIEFGRSRQRLSRRREFAFS